MNKLRTLLVFLFCAAAAAQTVNGNTGQSVSGITSSPAYVTGGGTANAQTATYSPAISAWTAGLDLCWLPTAANTTATPTFSPNGLAAKTITKNGTAPLAASDITTTAIACGTYDGTVLQLQNPQTSLASPPAFIQSAGNVQVFTTSVSQAYSSNVAFGDLLLVSFHCASAVSSMSDSKGNVYTLLARSVDNSVSVWGALANATGADTVTVNVVNSSNRVALFIEEYSNAIPVLDGSAVFSTTLANPVTVSTTTTSANSLIWSYIELGTSSATTPVPTAAGFTSRISYNSGTSEIQVAASKTTSVPGTQTASWTNLGTSGVNAVILALRTATNLPNVVSPSGTLQISPHTVIGSVTLTGSPVAVTLTGSAVFTSSSSYSCALNDATATDTGSGITYTSGTAFTVAGSGTNTYRYICVGN